MITSRLVGGLQRNHALDGLRGIAALSVFLFHANLLNGGFYGVDVFFVLSGFLITSLLAQEYTRNGRIDFSSFYIARALRLAPAMLLFVMGYLVIASSAFPLAPVSENVAFVLLYLTDYSLAHWRFQGGIDHTWSLSVEGKFYLLWPAVMVVLFDRSWQRRAALLATLYLAATAWRIYRAGTADWDNVYYPMDSRLSGLVLGALLATVIDNLSISRVTTLAISWPCIVVALTLFTTMKNDSTALMLPMTAAELATAGIILALHRPGLLQRIASLGPLVFTGRISYAFYLWHILVGVAVYHYAGDGWWTWPATRLALTYACAITSWYAVEQRAAVLRHQFSRKQTMTADEPR